ncbi:hypothetical protein BGZ95_009197 [Linnemannia exigua]|uniref:Uncharacterized protein n=1 Tax=Linnemannia exigua TaxID=604196 RepID=A0AAD4H5X7_9FUNG|nr:hypothetical protein BGZ95_009197 [Linnemannia exigua]
MGSVRITRAPEERSPPTSLNSTITQGAMYYPPPPSLGQSISMVPPTPVFIPSPVPATVFPIPAVTVAHVRTTSDMGLSNQQHQRIRSNAPQTSLHRKSVSSIVEGQVKVEWSQNTVQTAEAGTPISPILTTRNPQTQALLESKDPQALPIAAAITPASTAATIVSTAAAGVHAGGRPTSNVPTTDSRSLEWGFALPSAVKERPKELIKGAPKQLNIQPRPQAWFDPKDINQAPQETQDRIQSYMDKIQSRDWHESPLPRLFIVLPKRCLHDDKLTPSWDKFRFFWMCEYVESSSSTPSPVSTTYGISTTTVGTKQGSLVPHVGHHGGYDLAKPEEFFRKYRAALLLNLKMFKGDIELYLDLMISHLEQLSSEVTDKVVSAGKEMGAAGDNHEELPILSDEELGLIRSLLVPTTPTDSGMDELHNQYRVVDKKGHVQWICLHHMRERLPNFDPESIKNAIGIAGTYTAQEASIEMTDLSNVGTLKPFNQFHLLSNSGVQEIIFDLSKAEWWSEYTAQGFGFSRQELWRGISNCQPTSLAFTGHQQFPSYVPFDRSLTTGPLLELLLKNQQMQCLRIENAQGLLKHIKPDIHVQKFGRLRVLEFTIQPSTFDVENIKQALAVLVSSAPGLCKLKIVWDDLSASGPSHVMAFLNSFALKLRQTLGVDLKTAGEDISMTVKAGGTYQDAHLQVSSLAMAEKHPLTWQKAIRTLTIKERESLDSVETKTILTRILGLNPGLTTLRLECWAVDFQSAETAINSIVSGVLCGLTKVTFKDSRVDEEDGIADELSVTQNRAVLTAGSIIEDNAVVAEVRASSHELQYSKYRHVAVDNSLFYLHYGPSIRNMRLGRNRQQELAHYLDGIQGHARVDLTCLPIHGYRRIHLTCLAIHGYWDKLDQVLERARASLKLLAVREKVPLATGNNNSISSSGASTISTWSGFAKSKIADLFRGERLVVIHQDLASDDVVRRVMAPSRTVVTFASDEGAWDQIVSELFQANKL